MHIPDWINQVWFNAELFALKCCSYAGSGCATEHADRQACAEVVSGGEVEQISQLGPIAYAKLLCDRAELTREQRGPVALIARDMEKQYQERCLILMFMMQMLLFTYMT